MRIIESIAESVTPQETPASPDEVGDFVCISDIIAHDEAPLEECSSPSPNLGMGWSRPEWNF